MTRRRGGDKLFKKNQELRLQEFHRQKQNRIQRISVIIACEGEKTEREYFQEMFRRLIGNRRLTTSSLVLAEHKHTDPKGVLEDLLKYDRNGMKYEDFNYKWIVIDRDEERISGGGHPKDNFQEALNKARQKKIEVAYSNPCFEIWPLLHFEYRNTAISRDELQKVLKKKHKISKGMANLYQNLLPNQHLAIQNAETLIGSYGNQPGVNPENDNPCTTVHNLVKKLISLGES